MTKARKAPAKKPLKQRGGKWANIILLIIGALVALSMILTGVFTLNAQPGAPSSFITPSAIPLPTVDQPTVIVPTPVP